MNDLNQNQQTPVQPQQPNSNIQQEESQLQPPYQQPVSAPVAAADNTKLFSILAYFPFLWLVGLLADRNNPKVMYHVNQGILFTIAAVVLGIAVNIVGAVLMAILPILFILVGLLNTAVAVIDLIWFIIGLVNACNGVEKPLPVIGTIATIVK
ncbi:MAG: hypothetical protein HFE39_02450 [Clostridiales bacterium]|jgi:uncharacterized membrane protein|nr:hypothetical protein [Clostridiales bacterium]